MEWAYFRPDPSRWTVSLIDNFKFRKNQKCRTQHTAVKKSKLELKGDLPTVLCTGSRKTMCREEPDKAFTVTDTATYAHEKTPYSIIKLGWNQRYSEITHDPLLCSVAQGIFWLSTKRLSRSTFKRGRRGESILLYSVVLQRWCPA